jgi:AraC-like DNA-binding protein
MKKSQFYLYHNSFLETAFRSLKSLGASAERISNGLLINRFNLNSSSTYLPNLVFFEFIEKMIHDQGIDHISGLYKDFKLEELSDFGKFLTTCYSLHDVILEGIKYNYLVQTNGKLHLDIHGATAYFYITHLDSPSHGRLLSEEIEFTMMLRAIQMVMGNHWKPLSVTLSTEDEYWVEGLFTKIDFPVYHNCLSMGFILKTEDLSTKNPNYISTKSPQDWNSESSSEIILKTLEGHNFGSLPSLKEFAQFFGYNRRTIIRKLVDEGTNFSKLLQTNLRRRSLTLLKNPSLSINEIGQFLGYANTPNFIRAFKQWTKISPQNYRTMLTKLNDG